MHIKNKIFDDIFEVGDDGVFEFKNYLAGHWVRGDEFYDLKSPIDDTLVARVGKVTSEQLEKVLEITYNKGRSAIRNYPGQERMNTFIKSAELLKETQDDFINVLVKGGGKPWGNAQGEVKATIERFEKTTMEYGYFLGHYIPGDWNTETISSEAIVKREPFGILLAISPFNYPLYISMAKIIPGLLLGNAAILKPARSVPLAALMITRLLEKANLPKECLSTVTVSGRDLSKIIPDRRINTISFTGSTETGINITKNAGIKQLHLELGGKDPAIVLKDAELDFTIDAIIKGIVGNSGQRCDGIRFVLVDSDIYEPFKEKFINDLGKYIPKNPMEDKNAVMGPLINNSSADEMENAVKTALHQGAIELLPFRRNNNYVWPCVLELSQNQLENIDVYKEEIFGPLCLLIKFNNVQKAIEIANGTQFGLDAAIFGKDDAIIRKIARKLEFGAVFINTYPKHGIGYYPFGGMKDSGIGREGLGFSIHQLTTTKTIVTNFKGRGVWEYFD